MLRFLLLLVIFLLSTLCVFKAPFTPLEYAAFQATEKGWPIILLACALLATGRLTKRYRTFGTITGWLAIILFLVPIFEADFISATIDSKLDQAFGPCIKNNSLRKEAGFSIWAIVFPKMVSQVPFKSYVFDTGHEKLTLDFYPSQKARLSPCILVIHGGGWLSGNSQEEKRFNSRLAALGYHVAAINYRLAPLYHYPCQLDDVHEALDYLRKNSANLDIDTSNFVLMGRSAGGQIALSAAFTRQENGLRGVISLYGPSNLESLYKIPPQGRPAETRRILENYLGYSYNINPKIYSASSPVIQVEKYAIPTLLIHGENDPVVSYLQSLELDKKLAERGVAHLYVGLPWATHSFDFKPGSPGEQVATYVILNFIDHIRIINE